MRRYKSNARPAPSEHLPPTIISVNKREVSGKPADDERRANTALRASGSYSDGFSASQNGFRPSTVPGGVPQVLGVTATAQPAAGQATGNGGSNAGEQQRSPRLMTDQSRPARRPEVDDEPSEWKTRSKEEDEKRLREKEQQLRILQVVYLYI